MKKKKITYQLLIHSAVYSYTVNIYLVCMDLASVVTQVLKAEQREASSEKACTGSYCQEQDFFLMSRLETNTTFQMLSLNIL